MLNENNLKTFFVIFLAFALNFTIVIADASFQVTSFSCSPSESVINSIFSCTAQVKNNGDASGTVSTATLYPDANNWLENSNYPQSSGTSVSPGQTTEITFSGLKAIKSGNNGFSKIMLDSVTDTYVADNNIKVNIINVIVTISNSASSAAMSASITSTTEVTAGGNIDVSLSFTSNSGGCSVGSQTNPKTISSMTDGSKQSRTWTITQGTSGNCQYTISAAATGAGGIASKIDSTSSTITCTDCPTTSTTSSRAGGGAGGAGAKTYIIGKLLLPYSVELGIDEKVKFNISDDKEHVLTLVNVTETTATITIQSTTQKFTLKVEDEINVDLDSDNSADISVKLKSINIISNKATLVLKKVSGGVPTKPEEETPTTPGEGRKIGEEGRTGKVLLWIGIIFFALLAIISGYYLIKKRKLRGGR